MQTKADPGEIWQNKPLDFSLNLVDEYSLTPELPLTGMGTVT